MMWYEPPRFARCPALLHERLDVGAALDRAESADPFTVGCEQRGVGGEVAAVEVAAVIDQRLRDLLLVFELFEPGLDRALFEIALVLLCPTASTRRSSPSQIFALFAFFAPFAVWSA